jgi:hypothetical protein
VIGRRRGDGSLRVGPPEACHSRFDAHRVATYSRANEVHDGCGRGEAAQGGLKVTVEVSSVNRKQGEVQVSLPRVGGAESRVRDAIHQRVARGRVSSRVLLRRRWRPFWPPLSELAARPRVCGGSSPACRTARSPVASRSRRCSASPASSARKQRIRPEAPVAAGRARAAAALSQLVGRPHREGAHLAAT